MYFNLPITKRWRCHYSVEDSVHGVADDIFSFNLSNVAELFGNWIYGDGAQGQEEKSQVPVLQKTLKSVISRCYFAEHCKKSAKMCAARAQPLLCSLKPIVFWRSRCRRRRGNLSSPFALRDVSTSQYTADSCSIAQPITFLEELKKKKVVHWLPALLRQLC